MSETQRCTVCQHRYESVEPELTALCPYCRIIKAMGDAKGEMEHAASLMRRYDGPDRDEFHRHGTELSNAADIIESWAQELEERRKEREADQ